MATQYVDDPSYLFDSENNAIRARRAAASAAVTNSVRPQFLKQVAMNPTPEALDTVYHALSPPAATAPAAAPNAAVAAPNTGVRPGVVQSGAAPSGVNPFASPTSSLEEANMQGAQNAMSGGDPSGMARMGVSRVNLAPDPLARTPIIGDDGNFHFVNPPQMYKKVASNGTTIFSDTPAGAAVDAEMAARDPYLKTGRGSGGYTHANLSPEEMGANRELDAQDAAGMPGGVIRPSSYYGTSSSTGSYGGVRPGLVGKPTMSDADLRALQTESANEHAVRAAESSRTRMGEFQLNQALRMRPQNYAEAVKGQGIQAQGRAALTDAQTRAAQANPFRDIFGSVLKATNGDVDKATRAAALASAGAGVDSPYGAAYLPQQYTALAGQLNAGPQASFGGKVYSPQEVEHSQIDPTVRAIGNPYRFFGDRNAAVITEVGANGEPESATRGLDASGQQAVSDINTVRMLQQNARQRAMQRRAALEGIFNGEQ